MSSTPSATERAILATLSYFDLFDYPLTTFELWKWLYVDGGAAPTLAELTRVLHTSRYLRARIESERGFCALKGRLGTIETRNERYIFAERKFNRVRRVLRVLGHLPFIRAVAVCNSLAYANSRDAGDLDLLILTEPGRIWTTRFFTTGLATLLGWRPASGRTRDAVCLSFFLSADRLQLRDLALDDDDLYFRYWIDQLVPVYGDASLIAQLQEQNAWYRERLPNAHGTSASLRRTTVPGGSARTVRRVLEALHRGRVGDAAERSYRALQLRMLPTALRALANRDTRVIVNNHMLKFHEGDRREAFSHRFTERLQEVA